MRKLFGKLGLVICMASSALAWSDESANIQSAPTEPSLKTSVITPADDTWRANLPLDPEAATDAYLARITPEAKSRADAYFEGGYWLILWNLSLTLLITWVLVASRWSARLRDRIERWTSRRHLRVAIYTTIFLLVSQILSFPLSYYQFFLREHKYGLANQTFGPWLNEQLIGLAVSVVLFSVLITALYAVIRKLPRSWPAWGTVVFLAFMCLTSLIAPVFIAPLFNTYKPVENSEIREGVLSIARANGIVANDIFEFDASKQSNRVSANVSGFLNTMRISLNDNLLRRSSTPEIFAVMGHEIGHYALNHVYKLIVEFGIIFLFGFYFVQWGFVRLQSRFGQQWQIRSQEDVAGLPLIVALFGVFMVLATPLTNTIIRSHETEADLFGVNTSQEPDGMAEVQLKLMEYRKPNPGPIEEFIFFDHPAPRKRILAAMRWKAERATKNSKRSPLP